MKGQIAFESLIVLLVAFTGAIAIGAYYIQTHDDTLAISAAKAETLSQIGAKNENIIIEYVRLEKTGSDANIIIKTTPKTSLDTVAIQQRVAQTSNYKTAIISIE